ncbi:nitrate regulatory gene2 protein-like isoform X2 [Tasmannia lanceolata]|uniref:nitrate regulatory gene2 protein-like isoform X2 n=1 Tax=Tasmannia lanceolata TaxID=3420 RepID=UPI0040638E31
MGCSNSKLDSAEAVQLCKDRRRFIKQAVEHRIQFAASHIAYVQSLRRVSLALRKYVEGDENREFSNSYTTPPSTPIKKMPLKSLSTTPIQSNTGSTRIVNYLRSGGNPSVIVEERPQSAETVRIESYTPTHHFGIDGFFTMQSPPMHSSFLSSPYNRPTFPPPSPQTSQWDLFWNPFSSLDIHEYPTRDSLDQTVAEEERNKIELNCASKVAANGEQVDINIVTDTEHEAKGSQSQTTESIVNLETQNAVELEVCNEEQVVVDTEAVDETPGFTVYVNRRPTSMTEVVKDLEAQFMMVCDSANEVATMLEAIRGQCSSKTNELTASSRSSSSKVFHTSSSSRDDGYDTSSDVSEESFMLCQSHQSTLDRLYEWEKKLYEEVKSGERIRIAYEKYCAQLRNQDVEGGDPSAVDKTKATIRDLHTRIKVYLHSVESVSKRIETLRDEELQPQIMELIQGLAKMWRVMAECHLSQKRTIDEAKLLLSAGTPTKLTDTSSKLSEISGFEPNRHARSATNLESELQNWRICFDSWITSQKSYINSLTGWALRCAKSSTDPEKLPFSPRSFGSAPLIYGICIQWSRFIDEVNENPVIDGLDFFAAGIGSVYGNPLREEETKRSKRFGVGFSPGKMEVVEVIEKEEKDLTAKKTAEVAVRVFFAGISVAVSSLKEFAVNSAEGYQELVKQWERDTCVKVGTGE